MRRRRYITILLLLVILHSSDAQEPSSLPSNKEDKIGININFSIFNPSILNGKQKNHFNYVNSLYFGIGLIYNRLSINSHLYSKTYKSNSDSINGYILNKDELLIYTGYHLGIGYEFKVLKIFTIMPRASFGIKKLEDVNLNSKISDKQQRLNFDQYYGTTFRAKLIELNDGDSKTKEQFLLELESNVLYFPEVHKSSFNYSKGSLNVLFGLSVKYILK